MKTQRKATVSWEEAGVKILEVSANEVNGIRLFYGDNEIPDTDAESEIVEGKMCFDLPAWIPEEDFIQKLNENNNNPMSTLVSLKFEQASKNEYYDPKFNIDASNAYAKIIPEVGYGIHAEESQKYRGTFIAQWFIPYEDSLHSRELIVGYFKPDSKNAYWEEEESFSLTMQDNGVLVEAEVGQYRDFNDVQISFLPIDISHSYYKTLINDTYNTFGENLLYELSKNKNDLDKALDQVFLYKRGT